MSWAQCSAVLALAVLCSGPLTAQEPSEESTRIKARSHLIVGEVAKVDLRRQTLTLRTDEAEPREYDLDVDEGTRISSGGRVARLEDLRPGARVLATCADEPGGRHRARSLKLARPRSPAPSPSPSTAAPPAQ